MKKNILMNVWSLKRDWCRYVQFFVAVFVYGCTNNIFFFILIMFIFFVAIYKNKKFRKKKKVV